MRAEAVSAFVQAPAHVVVEARLRYFLDEMAHCLDDAHMADRGSAGLHMSLGVADEMMHARFQDAHDRFASKLTKESNIR